MRLRSFAGRLGATAVLVSALVAGVAPVATAAERGPDRARLNQALAGLHAAGMPGVYAQVREHGRTWRGAAGVADTETGRPVRPYFEHRSGSITKTFVSTGVLQQVAAGRIELDAPVGRYVPDLVPGERGQQITVRMILQHTSGINDHLVTVWASPALMESTRLQTFPPRELVRIGLALPPLTPQPGQQVMYSNTNYVLAGLLLERVTGQPVREYLTRHVIRAAGIGRTTYFPGTDPVIRGPHSKAYESWFGTWVPPKDFSVHNMSWGGVAGEIVSTMDDLNQFYRALLGGRLLPAAQLAEMKKVRPWIPGTQYGLGLYQLDLGPCGTFWGHDGAVLGMGTVALSSEDARKQLAFGFNWMKYPRPSPIDPAMGTVIKTALCDGKDVDASARAESSIPLMPAAESQRPAR